MIRGIGTDIVETSRIRDAVDRWGRRFLDRVFTADEVDYAYRKTDPFPSLAVRFAAKEAVVKAVRFMRVVSLTDIEVLHTDGGAPVIMLHGQLADAAREHGIEQVHLSLSHEREYGLAFVVLEGKK